MLVRRQRIGPYMLIMRSTLYSRGISARAVMDQVQSIEKSGG